MFSRLFSRITPWQFKVLRGPLPTHLSASPVDARPIRITVYSRANCTCCEKALEQLSKLQPRYAFTVNVVNIDADSDLKARYDTTVPVVMVNGVERFRGKVNPVLLERLLRAST